MRERAQQRLSARKGQARETIMRKQARPRENASETQQTNQNQQTNKQTNEQELGIRRRHKLRTKAGRSRGCGGRAAYMVHERVDGSLLRQRAELRSSAHGRVQPRQKRPRRAAAAATHEPAVQRTEAHRRASLHVECLGVERARPHRPAPTAWSRRSWPPYGCANPRQKDARGRCGLTHRRHHGCGSTSVNRKSH